MMLLNKKCLIVILDEAFEGDAARTNSKQGSLALFLHGVFRLAAFALDPAIAALSSKGKVPS